MFFRLLGIFIIAVCLTFGWFWNDYKTAINEPASYDNPRLIEVKRGQSFKQIAYQLEQQGIIRSAFWAYIHARITKQAQSIKTGEFAIQPDMSAGEIITLLVSGKVVQHSIMFPEGCRFSEMINAITTHPKVIQTSLIESPDDLLDALGSDHDSPEGLFFPDTYYFTKGTTDFALLKRAYQRMQEVLTTAWDKRAKELPIKTPYEALILASIVEKETALPDERRSIAGVFTRRLDKRMRLQTDPTVIYGMGEAYKGNITRQNLRQDTPYNTYTRHGLPPTPIAMPGKGAIEAAVDPEDSDTLYFVARGDGSHIFSTSLREHNNAVNQYQRKR